MIRRQMLPPLVLLHGFTQTRQSWRRTAQALAGRYRAITPDLPGHGQAAHRTPSFDACTAYVRALAPQTPFTLAGYSMGGRIALHAALHARPRSTRLILVGASPGLARPEGARAAHAAADDALADRIETDRHRGLRRANGARSRCSPASRERVAAARLRRPPAQHAARPRATRCAASGPA